MYFGTQNPQPKPHIHMRHDSSYPTDMTHSHDMDTCSCIVGPCTLNQKSIFIWDITHPIPLTWRIHARRMWLVLFARYTSCHKWVMSQRNETCKWFEMSHVYTCIFDEYLSITCQVYILLYSYVTWLIHTRPDSSSLRVTLIHISVLDTHIYATWLMHMCHNSILSHWHDPFIRDMACPLCTLHSYTSVLDTRIYATWLMHMWHDSSCLIDMTHSYETWPVLFARYTHIHS